MTEPRAVFSTAAFPTIEFIALLVRYQEVTFDIQEHFVKQTNRNRYHLAGANGIQTLHIPVRHRQLYRLPIGEIEISEESPWQRTHWRSISAAYNRSAYFEYYADGLKEIFFADQPLLFGFNESLIQWTLKILHYPIAFSYTTVYSQKQEYFDDFRTVSDQKSTLPVQLYIPEKYPQVFEDKNGFIPNLSVLDLLFNTGPGALSYLQRIR